MKGDFAEIDCMSRYLSIESWFNRSRIVTEMWSARTDKRVSVSLRLFCLANGGFYYANKK